MTRGLRADQGREIFSVKMGKKAKKNGNVRKTYDERQNPHDRYEIGGW